jgi:hypothetical protein
VNLESVLCRDPDWWKFWAAVAIAWSFGFIPGSSHWFIRRDFRTLDRLRRQAVGLKPRLRSRLISLRDVASVLVIAGCAGRCFGWW